MKKRLKNSGKLFVQTKTRRRDSQRAFCAKPNPTYLLPFYKAMLRRLIDKTQNRSLPRKKSDREVQNRVKDIEKKIAKRGHRVEQIYGPPDEKRQRISCRTLRAQILIRGLERLKARCDRFRFRADPNSIFLCEQFSEILRQDRRREWSDNRINRWRGSKPSFRQLQNGGGLLAKLRKGCVFYALTRRINDNCCRGRDINLSCAFASQGIALSGD